MDCTEERTLPRFQDSVRTTQHSADTEVIASQKQKDTLNTFKTFLQEQRDKQTNSYFKRICLKTTNNGKYFFSFFIMNVVTKKVTHLHIWSKKKHPLLVFKFSFGDCFSQIASAS